MRPAPQWGTGLISDQISPEGQRSLQGDGSASALKGCLCLLRGFLVRSLKDSLGCTINEVLRLLQAEAREGAHLLDDLDLLVADGVEDDVELGLLLRGSGVAATATRAGGGRGD